MKNQTFYLLAALCVLTHLIRTVYEILKHKKILTTNKLTFIIIFTNMAVLWISWFAMCGFDAYKIDLPLMITILGLLLEILGVVFFLTALFTIKTLEDYSGDLVTTGIYSKIRHPMYLGFILWAIGGPIFYGAAVSSVFALLFIGNILFWRHLEELELDKRFPGYKDYRTHTWF